MPNTQTTPAQGAQGATQGQGGTPGQSGQGGVPGQVRLFGQSAQQAPNAGGEPKRLSQ